MRQLNASGTMMRLADYIFDSDKSINGVTVDKSEIIKKSRGILIIPDFETSIESYLYEKDQIKNLFRLITNYSKETLPSYIHNLVFEHFNLIFSRLNDYSIDCFLKYYLKSLNRLFSIVDELDEDLYNYCDRQHVEEFLLELLYNGKIRCYKKILKTHKCINASDKVKNVLNIYTEVIRAGMIECKKYLASLTYEDFMYLSKLPCLHCTFEVANVGIKVVGIQTLHSEKKFIFKFDFRYLKGFKLDYITIESKYYERYMERQKLNAIKDISSKLHHILYSEDSIKKDDSDILYEVEELIKSIQNINEEYKSIIS